MDKIKLGGQNAPVTLDLSQTWSSCAWDEVWSRGTYDGDGLALVSTSHPKAPLWRRLWWAITRRGIRKGSLETIEVSDTFIITDPETLAKWEKYP